jgi:hypothetical protein
MSVSDIVEEGLWVHHPKLTEDERRRAWCARCATSASIRTRASAIRMSFPAGSASASRSRRAVVLEPTFIVLDEPTSALDMLIQAQMVDLLRDLQKRLNLTYLFISHDLRVVAALASRLMVMRHGKVVEEGPAAELFANPRRLYPRAFRRGVQHRDRAGRCGRAIDRASPRGGILMSAILLAIIGWDPKNWDQLFHTLAPQRDVRLWPERAGNPDDVAYACVWKPPPGLLAEHRNLKAVFSLGAGVDDILADQQLPDVPVIRVIDADLTMRMTEYVVLHVLTYHRHQRVYEQQQRARIWHDHEQPPANDVSVGIMGLGELGQAAAVALQRLGFRVHGWSRTQKIIPGVETFYGSNGFEPFLRRSEIWSACCRRRRRRAAS